jgi:hypothetical protein
MILTVIYAFASYKVGDQIKDPAEIEAILAGENSGKVVRASDHA